MEELETRLGELRVAVRRALAEGDRRAAGRLRQELRRAELAWDRAVEIEDPDAVALPDGAAFPEGPASHGGPPRTAGAGRARDGCGPFTIREQVHQALALLRVPSAGRLIVAVHEAFFAGSLTSRRLSSLRRDEERSFRANGHARPYYLCAALAADLLVPARGLFAVSTWPMDRRVIGPLSPRVDHLTATIRIAERLHRLAQSGEEPSPGNQRLISRLARSIPGAMEAAATMVDPDTVIRSATAELDVHAESDRAYRALAARRAIEHLDAGEQLFGGGARTWKVKET